MSPLAIPPILCGLAPLEPEAPAAALAIAVVGSGHPSRGHSHRWTRRVADVLMSQTAHQTIAPSSNPSRAAVRNGRRRRYSGDRRRGTLNQ